MKEFVRLCDVYVWTKNLYHHPHGLFNYYQSLHHHGLQLPWILSYNSILVVVDYFTKMVHFIPCKKTIIGKKTTNLFLDHVFQNHYLPKDIFLIVDLCIQVWIIRCESENFNLMPPNGWTNKKGQSSLGIVLALHN